jgi:capsular exopolysaccharide synthesis family protein
MKKEVIVHKNPKSPISEVFRTLRTNIQFMNSSKKMKTLLVTSTFPGEGKSWVTSNLAITFAQAGKKVVLIDADMRKGRQYVLFGTLPRPGLSNYLSEVDADESEDLSEEIIDYIQETEVENLYLMPAGNIPPNPSELLVSAQMVRLLDELKKICDIVIIDGTPCELVTDSVILSRIVDSTIVVTAYKITKKEALERVIKNIKSVGGNLAGVVFNKIPISGKKYEEKYYYYGKDQSTSNITSKSKGKSNYSNGVGTQKKNRTTEINKQRVARKVEVNDRDEIQSTETNELPKAMKKNKVNKDTSLERTNDILKQINQYLDQEKKKLN